MEEENKRKVRAIQIQMWKEINESMLRAEKKMMELTPCQEIILER